MNQFVISISRRSRTSYFCIGGMLPQPHRKSFFAAKIVNYLPMEILFSHFNSPFDIHFPKAESKQGTYISIVPLARAYLLYRGTSGKIILPTSASGGKVVGRIFKNLYKTCVCFVQKTHRKRCARGEISPFAGCNKQHCGRCAVATDACFPQKSGTLRFSICTFFRSDA